MKGKQKVALVLALILACVVFASCAQASGSSGMENSSSQFVDSTQNTPTEAHYFSIGVVLGENECGLLYGQNRNDVAAAYESAWQGTMELPAGVTFCPTSVSFYNKVYAGHGLLAGVTSEYGSNVFCMQISQDGGNNWEAIDITFPQVNGYYVFYDFGFTSSMDGWFAAEEAVNSGENYGEGTLHLMVTNDGGKTWHQKAEHDFASFQDIVFTSANHGYMAATTKEGGPILETLDGGETWRRCQVDLPANFVSTENLYEAYEFVWEQGNYYCIINNYTDSNSWGRVKCALIPVQKGEATVWSTEKSWEFPQGVSPKDFFEYVINFFYVPDYLGMEKYGEKYSLDHSTVTYMRDYLLTYKPDSIQTNDSECIMPADIVSDMLKLIYDIDDFDATQLDDYNSDLGGVVVHLYCEHGFAYQDAVYHSVDTKPNGDIEVIRDIGWATNDGVEVDRREAGCVTEMQRCVFRPVTSASGVKMFTLISCELI